MSRENVELWRRSIEEFTSSPTGSEWERWIERAAELWDPEIEWDASVANLPETSSGRGRESFLGFWREWLAAWETLQFDYELVDAGDRVVMLLEQRMRGRSTGIEVPTGKYAQVATFRNGLMVRWKLYLSQEEALEAAGVPSTLRRTDA